MQLVCTEVGPFNCDVLGVDDNKSVEIEVKKSVSDFKADFRKTSKHRFYSQVDNGSKAAWVPNYMYYFTYADFGERCLKVLDDLEIKHAGLATLDKPSVGNHQSGWFVTVLRKAPRLHSNKPHPRMVRAMQLRMGSELTTLRLHLELLKRATPEQVAAILSEASGLAKSLTERPDWETEDGMAQEVRATTVEAGESPGQGSGQAI